MSETVSSTGTAAHEARVGGFDLSSVCWGYRDIFARTIEGLFEQGLIGEERQEVTRHFFSLLKSAEQNLFDHVLKELLESIGPLTAWILDIPSLFEEVTTLGCRFAENKLYYGINYFRLLGEGGLGRTPEQVDCMIRHCKSLMTVDNELAFAFLKGFGYLLDRLTLNEIDAYVTEGLRVFARNRSSGLKFMECALKASENVIVGLTKECRLDEKKTLLERLLRALSGRKIEIGSLGELDADELIERDSRMICMYKWLYVPERIRYFESKPENERWYLLQCIAASALFEIESFPMVHGHHDYGTCVDVLSRSLQSCLAAINLFIIVEYTRGLVHAYRIWPGAREIIGWGIGVEYDATPPRTIAEKLLFRCLHAFGIYGRNDESRPGPNLEESEPLEAIYRIIGTTENLFDTANLLTKELVDRMSSEYPGLDTSVLRSFAFLPDFLYPGSVSSPPRDKMIADLKSKAEKKRDTGDDDDGVAEYNEDESGDGSGDEEEEGESGIPAAYVYDEWSRPEGDYLRDYCLVHEVRHKPKEGVGVPEIVQEEMERVRRVFEMIKPSVASKEKYLPDGDEINPDLLTEYLVQKKREPSPFVNFYEKPFINRRDLSVLILLDVSGSTGEESGSTKILDVEKSAALLLGQGLASLGDTFSVCGFSGNGREDCRFFIYKSFEDTWDYEAKHRIYSAWPMSSTRIGAALRHSGHLISKMSTRQRLIILVTDGKPMDQAYDPETRYAQADVRMACEENRREGIHTFCISTTENSRADMEIMFPERRFVILEDIAHLPAILPGLYIRLTI
jgi:hypothetical protein